MTDGDFKVVDGGEVRILDGGQITITDTCKLTIHGGESNIKGDTMNENQTVPEAPLTRAEVQAMIEAATATEKARLWNVGCLMAKRDDLKVSGLGFATDDFKIALVTAVGPQGIEALGVPLTIGETPKAPWSALGHASADFLRNEVEVLGAGELLL